MQFLEHEIFKFVYSQANNFLNRCAYQKKSLHLFPSKIAKVAIKNLGPIVSASSAVLKLIGYKQPDRQAKYI